MMPAIRHSLLAGAALLSFGSTALPAQDAGAAREAMRARRDARRAAAQSDDELVRSNGVLAERLRVENSLRQALARAVRQRLNLTDQQAVRLMDVNRKFSEDRLQLARDEIRIRRQLRQSVANGDSSRSAATGRLLDELLDAQRKRLELQQKEQDALSEFLTPEQRVRYIGMMEQLRRRIQQRADSARAGALPPEE
ncbi:MAG: hypothetical protein U5K74_03560 [Gemmatimonadaceae bacterium]|nr:hypothetical protein [Gemmatimonadaceae bacterium]